jgi:GNAT superfamily N-acetyltransferase
MHTATMVKDTYTISMTNGSRITVLFGEATAQQQHKCYTLAASAWGSYLDEDEIIAREEYLSEQPLARKDGSRTWCLYRQDDHDQILSTCKTVHRDFVVKDSESTREVKGYCVTSVYTPQLLRGHGLASNMLNNVAQWLDGPGEAAVSVLYSGIPEFYEKVGWTTLSNTEIILSSTPWLQDLLGPYADLEVRSLSDADVQYLCAQDIGQLRVNTRHADVGMGKSRLAVLPTEDLVRYQHALSDFMGDLWHDEAPEERGAAYEDQAWLYWQHDFRGRCLYIQHVHNTIQEEAQRADAMTALFLAAAREANKWNFTSVATWDISPDVRVALDTLAQASSLKTSVCERHRTQRISLRWRYGEKKAGNVVMSNETYAWNSRS